MEKRRPTYDLKAVQTALNGVDRLAITVSAFRDALAMGFDRTEIVDVIQSLTHAMFYKSMTTYGDHRVWQDVYHATVDGLVLYVKIQADVVTAFRVMSFKEQ